MTYKEIMTMIHNACHNVLYNDNVFYNGGKGHEETIIQCATQIYIAQMNGNKAGEQE